MKLCALVSIAAALVAAQPVLSEEQLRGVASTGDHPMPSPALPRGQKGDETCGCYDITKHKCKCKDSVCSKNSCEKQDDEHFWTGGCSCGCPGKEVGKDCPEKPPHLEEEEDADVVVPVAVKPTLSEELRGSGDHPMPSPALPRGQKGDETCGCYDITKHKCKCKDSVCSKNSCEKQDDEHFWTGGCSCGCPGKEVGKDCPEKPPHLEEDADSAKRAAAAAVAAGGAASSLGNQ